MNENIAKIIKEMAEKDGYIVGFTSYKRLLRYSNYFNERDERYVNSFENRETNRSYHSENYIVFLFPYLTNDKLDILKTRIHNKEKQGLSIYTLSEDYHNLCRNMMEKYSELLTSEGYKSQILIDTEAISERTASFDAGLGFIGRNGNLINEEYGSYCFIGIISTDAPLETEFKEISDIETVMKEKCSNCNECIKACPAKILGGKYINFNRCLSFLTQCKNLSSNDMAKFEGRLFGCDSCQNVCPYNSFDKIRTSEIKEFESDSSVRNLNDEKLFNINKKEFLELKKYAFSWRGKSLLKRNAAISLIDDGKLKESVNTGSDKLNLEINSYISYRGNINEF